MTILWLATVLLLLLLAAHSLIRLVRSDGYGVVPPPRDRPTDRLPSRPYAVGR
ncbi:MAG: hypothetical protein KY451_01115 [Actinobacteria bacterium]|nr:hypothetical protein [Actinomycetota bacterium]MBW3646832.1 hypothetical protein [Actinomycetota bacterium]